MPVFTELLAAANGGNARAVEDLFCLVYDDLKRLAARALANETVGHTLQPTALVHEAYLRLLGDRPVGAGALDLPGDSRGRFFTAASTAMRRILIESARRKKRAKRGGGRQRVPLDPDQIAEPERADELIALDEALTALTAAEPKVGELVQLRYFGGLTLKEAAAVLGIAPRTADAYWAYARAWLLTEMADTDAPVP
ncbi:RNA polymerase sigma factor SigL [Gemmata obscuriglobus]|uniref:RNA polymerase subunit sigma n=1 Tax=Gemmata obscuriglobus TaxID=114 RepID=A0A2Z3GY29_9BACT|nr:ECF-type sigma factor [Gemmata obscuriglobus]AWM36407.1 RNA polymerase subunit sigma [Gemmata obscuriglobus]QEG30978.1 RNA polymerase sigma factor SigL [Gemmata obscuriglobus]VTS10313.1 rna polymerase sigma-70 ecf-like protein : RNA polymerase sigma-70 ECF-like protein OS=Rhodopirellula sp. SWK7 GN=RRSWK_04777 PE=4 SV=1: Sigma70_ECF [Gemmata obscuriglobus UQM 2246]